jgi:hypothetical protein
MKPLPFKEKTKTLSKPDSMADEQCSSLDVYCDGEQCISCWRPSWKERLSILLFGKVWLSVLFGETQPPVWITGERTPFTSQRKSTLRRFSGWIKARLSRPAKEA